MAPTLGVGLPVYNGARYLGETLASIGRQTFADYEVVVVDNASTDHTARIARQVAAGDPRISYVRNDSTVSLPENFNRAFALTRGELFAWVASDDLYLPEFFGRCVGLLRERPDAVGAFTGVGLIDEAGTMIGTADEPVRWDDVDTAVRFGDLASFRHTCYSVFAVVRRSVLAETQLMLPFYGSDRLLLAELALRGPMALAPEPLYFNRQHDQRDSARAKRRDTSGYYAGDPPPRALTWHYGRQLWRAVRRADLDPEQRRRVNRALAGWAVENRVKFARSAARGVLNGVLSGAAGAGRQPPGR